MEQDKRQQAQQQELLNPMPLNYAQYAQVQDDEIDLKELFVAIWRGKWIVIAITILFAGAAVAFALSKPNIYQSSALLAPAQSSSGSSLSKMAGQLGGLASLAGINIGGGEASQADLAVQVLKSRQFLDAFIKKHDLLIPLMAAKEWNAQENSLVINEELYNPQTKKWLREPKGRRGAEPTMQEAYEVFSKNTLSVNQDKESGLYTVSVKHFSPFIAQQWVTWLVEDINSTMRKRSITEAKQNLAYLEVQLQKTALADMQATFYSLIEEQTKSLMLAEVQEEFVFKVIDPPVAPELKAEPKRALICVLGTLLGGMLGVAIVLIRFAFRKEDTEALENN